jgi:hypothetical protein
MTGQKTIIAICKKDYPPGGKGPLSNKMGFWFKKGRPYTGEIISTYNKLNESVKMKGEDGLPAYFEWRHAYSSFHKYFNIFLG